MRQLVVIGITSILCCASGVVCQAQRARAATMGYGAVVAPRKTMSPQMIEALARYSQRMSDAEFQDLLVTSKLEVGQVYTLPGWVPVTFTLKNNLQKKHSFARYNVVLHRLELRDSTTDKTSSFYSHEDLTQFVLGDSKQRTYSFELLPYVSPKNVGPATFFETINTGAIRLLLLHELDVRPAIRNEALNLESKPAEYYRITRLFYLIEGQKAARELALNRRSVLRIFGERAKEADAYATSNQLDFTSLEHVLRLVERFNVPITTGAESH